MQERAEGGLWRNPAFLKLWAGKTIAELGAGAGGTALPLVGVLVLGAGPAQMGFLGAVAEAPVLLVALPAGLWVDRLPRRRLMIVADIGRAVLLATISLAAALGVLHLAQLYVVAALAGALSVVFGVADQSLLPMILPPERLLEGNSKLGISGSVAEIGGPSLGGLLVGLIGATAAVLCQAVTYLASASCLAALDTRERPSHPEDGVHPLRELGAGLHLVLGNPVLRLLAAGGATFTFFGSFIGALYTLFVVRTLGLSPAILGLSVGMGGVGALLGALLVERFATRLGQGRALALSLLAAGLLDLVLPAIHGPAPVAAALLLGVQLVGDVFIAMYLIGDVSMRQAQIPEHLLGRANAGMQWLTRGGGPLGAVLAGWLGSHLGVRPTLLIAMLGIIAATGWLLAEPVRRS